MANGSELNRDHVKLLLEGLWDEGRDSVWDYVTDINPNHTHADDLMGFMNTLFGRGWNIVHPKVMQMIARLEAAEPESDSWNRAFEMLESVVNSWDNTPYSSITRAVALQALRNTGAY